MTGFFLRLNLIKRIKQCIIYQDENPMLIETQKPKNPIDIFDIYKKDNFSGTCVYAFI